MADDSVRNWPPDEVVADDSVCNSLSATAIPKSLIFRLSCLSKRMFSGFISLWLNFLSVNEAHSLQYLEEIFEH